MPITFAAATSRVPGMTAWADAAPVAQKDKPWATGVGLMTFPEAA